jgi:protein TonB
MLKFATFLFSFVLHGLLVYVSLTRELIPETASAFEQGTGNDSFVIEQGIGIEGFMQEGEAVETVEANETPTQMSEARPQIDEVKPVEQAQETPPDEQLKDTEIIESKDGPAAEALPVEEEKPKEIEQQQPPQMATLEQLEEQQVVEEQRSAGQKQEGGDAGVRRAYLGKISKKLQSTKVNPHSRATGTVMVRFEVAPSGALLSREVIASSGSQLLDQAALAAVDKAAPFPAFPDGMKAEKIVEVVPYRFSVR